MANVAGTIKLHLLPLLHERLAKIAKRAVKLGLPAPEAHVVSTHQRVVWADDGSHRPGVVLVDVVIVGEWPHLPGYSFVAALTRGEGETGNLIRSIHDEAVPETFRHRHVCDHCSTQRGRKVTYLFHHVETDMWIQVGSSCIRDFSSRALTPEGLAFVAELRDVLDEDSYRGCKYEPDMYTYLGTVARRIREHGWVPRSKSYDGCFSTAEAAMLLGAPEPELIDMAATADALAWLAEWSDQGQYAHNLRVACAQPTAGDKFRGTAASVFAAKLRAEDEARKVEVARLAAEQAAKSAETIIAEVGTRVRDVQVEVVRLRSFAGTYGLRLLVVMQPIDQSQPLQTWTSSHGAFKLEEGQKLRLTGTVKKTGSYNGQAFTELSRCKFEAVS